MAINDISLTAGMRSNLIALQGTVDLLNRTQERLSTGKKVNTALDNPLNFFAAKDLNSRASDLAGFKDGMSEAVQTIKAANNGISAIEGLLAQAKALAATAKAGTAGTVTTITIDLASVTAGQTISIGGTTFTASAGLQSATLEFGSVVSGDTVTIGNTTYTAIGQKEVITLNNITAGQTITIGSTTYAAVGQSEVITLNNITSGQTVTFGSTTYTALGRMEVLTFANATAGQTITIGSTTYVGTTGNTVAATEFSIDTAALFAATLATSIAGQGSTIVTTSATGVTLSSTTSSQTINLTGVGTKVTTSFATFGTTQFAISATVGLTASSSAYVSGTLGDALSTAGSTITTTSGGTITLSATTSSQTINFGSLSITSTAFATIAATRFAISAGVGLTASSSAYVSGSLVEKANLTSATTNGGVITLDATTSAGTVNLGSLSISSTAFATLAATEFAIAASFTTSASSAYAANSFLTQAALTPVSTSGGLVTLSTTTSAGTVSEEGAIVLADTAGLYAFNIGTTDSYAATKLTAKIATAAASAFTAAASGVRITLSAGTSTLPSTQVVDNTASFTTVVNQDSASRTSLASQFAEILNQLDLLATDSSYKGINFLESTSSLDVKFGKEDTDKITIDGFDSSAATLLGKEKTAFNGWTTNADVNVDIAALTAATDTLTTESSRLSSGLSIINTRQDWVKLMVNTVTEGADKLTLADMNEEGANMLMLQTRQTLGTTALSLSAQAAQSVLRLFA